MLFMSAVEFGLRFGLSIIRFVGPDTIQFWNPDHPWWIWLLSVIQLGGYSVLYQGLLNVQELISSMLFGNGIRFLVVDKAMGGLLHPTPFKRLA
jgi:hypothetical protein